MKCMLATLGEAVVVILLSCGVGLAWNHYSDEGLDLSRDYFKKVALNTSQVQKGAPQSEPSEPSESSVPGEPGESKDPDPVGTEPSEEGFSTGVDANGLETVQTEDAVDYHSMEGLAAFVDARSRDHYEEAHISGAYYLNHYQSQKLIEDIRPELEAADILVVYCGGGDCEDSILLATSLISEYGFDFSRVYVYLGGMEEWKAGGHPITEGGER